MAKRGWIVRSGNTSGLRGDGSAVAAKGRYARRLGRDVLRVRLGVGALLVGAGLSGGRVLGIERLGRVGASRIWGRRFVGRRLRGGAIVRGRGNDFVVHDGQLGSVSVFIREVRQEWSRGQRW